MNPHALYCSGRYGGLCDCPQSYGTVEQCTDANPCPDCKIEALPVNLTVYTAAGSVTVQVREDSIEVKDGTLIAEGTVENDLNGLFTFINVIGYSTRH